MIWCASAICWCGNFNQGGLLAAPQGGLQLPGGPPGPITLYYGEEFGDEVPGFAAQVGGDRAAQGLCDDHVARSDGKVPGVTGFVPSGEQAELKQWLRRAAGLRAKHPALYQGSGSSWWRTAASHGDLKQTASEQIVYLLNVSGTPQSYSLPLRPLRSGSALVDLQSGERLTLGRQQPDGGLAAPDRRFLLLQ